VRITFVVPALEVSGGTRIVVGHAERLGAKGHDVLVVAPPPHRRSMRDWAKLILGRGSLAPTRRQANLTASNFRLHVPRRRGPIKKQDVPDADIIIATWWETVEWIWPMPASKGVKVHFIQGYDSPPLDVGNRVEAVWQLPTAKLAVAQWLVDLGRERFGIDEIDLVTNSVDEFFFSTAARNRGEPATVGFLFHNAELKDVPTTLAAIDRLRQVRPDIRLVSFGSVRPSPGELNSDVEFHHLPTQEQIANIYARCDVWLSTSRSEGFNLPPLEAMAGGCPAVCSKTGRPLEIIEDGRNGYLVDAGDVQGFTNAMLRVLSCSDSDWRKMSDAARRSVAYPTWSESNGLFEKALARVYESRRRMP